MSFAPNLFLVHTNVPNICHLGLVRHFPRLLLTNYYVNSDLDLAKRTNRTILNLLYWPSINVTSVDIFRRITGAIILLYVWLLIKHFTNGAVAHILYKFLTNTLSWKNTPLRAQALFNIYLHSSSL